MAKQKYICVINNSLLTRTETVIVFFVSILVNIIESELVTIIRKLVVKCKGKNKKGKGESRKYIHVSNINCKILEKIIRISKRNG